MATKFCAILLTVMPFASASIALNHGGSYGSESFGGGYASEGEGFAPITDLKHLGTFVGQPNLPPKIIRITKTVAVKVPAPYPVNIPQYIPYPVKIPQSIPYPLAVEKPYPVQIPQIIKIKEQVHSDGGSQSSGGYLSGSGGNFEAIGATSLEGHFARGANDASYFSGPHIYSTGQQGVGDNSGFGGLAAYQGRQGDQDYQLQVGYDAGTGSGSIEQEQANIASQSTSSGYGSHR